MQNLDVEFERMKKMVKAAEDEIVMAIMFHETWKPTAYDEDLHNRMGNSFATHSFMVLRLSLRREMLLSLLRLWDTDKRAIRVTAIVEKLRDREFFNNVVARRTADTGLSSSGIVDSMKAALEPKRDAAVALVRKYSEGGANFDVLKKLRTLRHERLAHRQMNTTTPALTSATDKEIEFFYEDNLELIHLLLSLVLGTAFNFKEAADVYRHHARYFWANARGERTEGHPNYGSGATTQHPL